MKTTLSLAVLVLASCSRTNEVELLLGPTEDSISLGFRCVDDLNGEPLIMGAVDGKFRLVVDVIDLGGRLPGCRGEELLRACTTSDGPTCKLLVSANPRRFCAEIDVGTGASEQAILAAVRAQLADMQVVANAPDHPVIIRAVTTKQTCDVVAKHDGESYYGLDKDLALGCAYTCPVQLDAVEGAISLYLDTFNMECEKQVRACAAFAGTPAP